MQNWSVESQQAFKDFKHRLVLTNKISIGQNNLNIFGKYMHVTIHISPTRKKFDKYTIEINISSSRGN